MNAFALSRILLLRLQRLARSYVEYLMLSSNSWPRSLGIRGVPIRCRLRTQNEQDSDSQWSCHIFHFRLLNVKAHKASTLTCECG